MYSGFVRRSTEKTLCQRLVAGICVVLLLAACGSKEKKAGQVLARVNGEEITVMQMNDELHRANVSPELQLAASKQLLESLIDRQLLLSEAMRNEMDRTVEVVQAIERAKTQIIVQAYLKKLGAKATQPSATEVDEYYRQHPEYFSERKNFEMQQIAIATRDFSSELRAVVDTAKSIDAVANWMDQHGIRYVRGQIARSTTDLPDHIVSKLKEMQKGQIFVVNEGDSSMINQISGIRIIPLSAKLAQPQIEQYLLNRKIKEIADAELTHLRSTAKIEYTTAPTAGK